jgi:hypothetical protein
MECPSQSVFWSGPGEGLLAPGGDGGGVAGEGEGQDVSGGGVEEVVVGGGDGLSVGDDECSGARVAVGDLLEGCAGAGEEGGPGFGAWGDGQVRTECRGVGKLADDLGPGVAVGTAVVRFA